MKKLICLVLVLLLASCTSNEKRVLPLPDEMYLVGVSLEDNNYNFSIKQNADLALSPTELENKKQGIRPPSKTTYVHGSSIKEPTSPLYIHSYIGEIQTVFVRMKSEATVLRPFDGVNVLNFQVFEKSEFKEGRYARILSLDVPYEVLSKRVILETEKYVVVDETDYFLADSRGEPVSVEEYLWQKWPNGHPDLDYALAIRDYVLSNIDIFLTQVA